MHHATSDASTRPISAMTPYVSFGRPPEWQMVSHAQCGGRRESFASLIGTVTLCGLRVALAANPRQRVFLFLDEPVHLIREGVHLALNLPLLVTEPLRVVLKLVHKADLRVSAGIVAADVAASATAVATVAAAATATA
eukprot:6629279-Prymnesium_polylepis.2